MADGNGHSARRIDGCKVFCATKFRDRDRLGDDVTDWIRANPALRIVDKVVTQSSDHAFHCVSITLFYTDPARDNPAATRDRRAAT